MFGLRSVVRSLSLRHASIEKSARACFRPAAFSPRAAVLSRDLSALTLPPCRKRALSGVLGTYAGSVDKPNKSQRWVPAMQLLILPGAVVPGPEAFRVRHCQMITVRGFASGPVVDEGTAKAKKTDEGSVEDEKKLGTFGKIKNMAKKYGKVFVFYWGGMYVSHLAVIFGAIQLTGLDGLALLRQIGQFKLG